MDDIGPEIIVLRLGYRIGRDPRITTHLGLVARAFGATKFFVSGDEDKKMFDTIKSVNTNFGGKMETGYIEKPIKWMRDFVKNGGQLIHLTMYGLPYKKKVSEVSLIKPIAIVVGGPKVPAETFQISTFNMAVGNQPHSEVAALGLLMDQLVSESQSLNLFDDAKFTIIPDSDGKNVIEK